MNGYLIECMNPITIVAVIVVFAIGLAYELVSKSKLSIGRMVEVGAAAAGVPTGISIIWCSFCPDDLPRLSGYQVYLALAGLTLMYCSVRVLAALASGNEPDDNEDGR